MISVAAAGSSEPGSPIQRTTVPSEYSWSVFHRIVPGFSGVPARNENSAKPSAGSSPVHSIVSIEPSAASLFFRVQPGGSENENGSTSAGIWRVTFVVFASLSPGTSSVNFTLSSGAATVGLTWMWAWAAPALRTKSAAPATRPRRGLDRISS